MGVNIHNLIAAIVPDVYCKPEKREKVKEILRKEGAEGSYLKAAEVAEVVKMKYMDFEKQAFQSGFQFIGIKSPIEKHTLGYDISANANEFLEQAYFWMVDYITKEFEKSYKLTDNFIASPGSSLFTDFLTKTTRVQEEASRILGNVNTVIRSVINLVYELRELKIVMDEYEKYRSKNSIESESALLALKQRWLDQVDIRRGGTALKQLVLTGANQPNFVLIIDAFMAPKNLEEAKKLDLNDRMKRLVLQRLSEFYIWLEQSETELKKRYELLKLYLKSQVNSVKLYARWVKPYLKAAKSLEQNASGGAYLVSGFNTAVFELSVLGEGKVTIAEEILKGGLPEVFETKIKTEKYVPLILIELKYRSTPESVGQHHRFRGLLELEFTSYGLSVEELKILLKEIEKDDFGEVYQAIEGATNESIGMIQSDIDEFINEKPKKDKKEDSDDTNPFSALFSGLFSQFSITSSKNEEKKARIGLRVDSDYEKAVRNQAIVKARMECSKMFNVYKGVNNMPSF